MPVSRPQPNQSSAVPLSQQSLRMDGVQVVASGRTILDIPQLVIPAGSQIGIAGVSGSGKTTLLHVMAGVRTPSAGQVWWGSTEITAQSPQQGDAWRRATVGLVFQDFQLIPELSAIENVLLTTQFTAQPRSTALRQRAHEQLMLVGVAAFHQRVSAMSRGEQQRVAIARACLLRPGLILADEPTASLDPANAAAVTQLLISAAKATGATLIVVSHDPLLLGQLRHTLHVRAGLISGPDGVVLPS
jgi:putative ABC transport system ATP-binding protein